MRPYIKLFVIVCLAISASVVFAEESATTPQADDVNKAGVPAFPYMAQITGDDVLIRSGPGTNYYACGKLNKTDKVKIVASQYSWSQIVPPAGSFSWISMQYIRIDSNDSSTGTVNADAVRVYAGSDQRKPIHSTTMQGKLDKGEKVHLLGEELEGYYKISPPPFAYLWVLTQYTISADAVAHAPQHRHRLAKLSRISQSLHSRRHRQPMLMQMPKSQRKNRTPLLLSRPNFPLGIPQRLKKSKIMKRWKSNLTPSVRDRWPNRIMKI